MATIYVGSARHDEHGACYSGGSAGDQLQTSTPDYNGEVSMQTMYTHSKGWYILRPKDASIANKIASLMTTACNNANIGYDQNQRNGIITYGVNTKTKTECDCSSLVRECVKEATGKDPGDFTTANEPSALEATGYFNSKVAYVSQSSTPVYNGDVLVTKSKGHTVVVVSGNPRSGSSSSTSSGTTSSTTSSTKKVAAAASSDESLAGTYKVTASDGLNIRYDAGTNKDVEVTIPKGTSVHNYGYYTSVSGTKWLLVAFTYNSKEYTGYGSSKYLEKTSGNSSSSSSSGTKSSTTGSTTSSSSGSLTVDGSIGTNTAKKWQKTMGTTQDGKIDGQPSASKKYWTSINGSVCSWSGGSSQLVKAWQQYLKNKGYSVGTVDGKLGKNTAKASQQFLSAKGYYTGSIDSYFGTNSAKALQKWLNTQ